VRELLVDAAQRAILYLEGINSRDVAPPTEAVTKLAQLDEPLPDGPSEPALTLRLLDEICSPATMATAGPRFFGFVIGGSLPVALAANWLAGAWDQNSAFYHVTPGTAQLERIALRWLLDLFGLPDECGGAFVTGASMASFSALAAARHAVLSEAGWSVEADGLIGAPPVTVVVGAEAHPTLIKSLGLLGLGRNRIVRIPVDSQGRMRADALPPLSGPTIVCAQAGNVNTGAFDPIAEICQIAHQAGAWVHVDGAFGLWAMAVPSLSHLTAGVANADSWATDFHKWLNVPYDSGLVFVREPRHLNAAMSSSAAYLIEGETRDPHLFVPEMSRRARAIEIWAALRSLGKEGLATLIDTSCAHAQRMARALQEAGFDVLNEIVLNQVLVAFGSPKVTRQVIAAIQRDGTCWCGGTVWQGKTAMRISVSSWATTDRDIDKSLEAIIRIASEVRSTA
jgi:glutamate/tyrosine decarboxylase-like PLP-dependent enzyme